MPPHYTSGPAPAYRLAPDTPAEIAADLARLCAPAGQNGPDIGIPMSAETRIPASTPAARAEVTAPDASAAISLSRETASESTAPASASPSRRLALFGGAAALLARLASRPAAARVADADRRLVDLAHRVEAQLADVIPVFHEGHDAPEQNAKLDAVDALYVEMAKIEATGPVGLAAKARAFRAGHRYDVQEGFELSNSLAYDVLQLGGVLA